MNVEAAQILQAEPFNTDLQSIYKAQGFVRIRGVFDAQTMQSLKRECDRLLSLQSLIQTDNIRCRWANHVVTNECRFDSFDPVIDLSPVVERVAHHPELVRILNHLYGESACLFKDKLIYKPSGAPGYDLHQDYIGWSEFPRSFMTVMIAIDPSTPESGATEFFGGYKDSLAPEDGEFHRLPEQLVAGIQSEIPHLYPGDIACFNGYTPHRSAPNLTDHSRRLLYLSYNAQSDGGDMRRSHYDQYHAWLREKYAQHGRTTVYFR